MSTLRSLLRATGLQALAGLAVWALVAVVAANVDSAALDLVAVLLLFGQLVIVPLGLLLLPPARGGLEGALHWGGRALFRIGGVAALIALAVPRGELSAAIAALYLVPALLVAASGVLRLGRTAGASDVAAVAAGLLLAFGALLFVLHRQDVAFAGFPELAVQLGAVHLHFVGFGAVVMAGALARRRRRIGAASVALLVIGSAVQPFAEVGGAVVLAGLVGLVAGTLVTLGDPELSASARRLLFVSIATAVFVGAMAAADIVGRPFVDIGSMVRLHGSFAALGTVLAGLVGWRLAGAR
jgi:YndJ-like protein